MIIADYHLHSNFSSDSDTKAEDMIEQGIKLGLKTMCFTDHMDYDFPPESGYSFVFNPDEYFKSLTKLKDEYKNKIEVLIGIELGLRPYLNTRYATLMKKYDFDFAIGSSHLVGNLDPYQKEYWENKSEHEAMTMYFQSIIDNIRAFTDFDVYGHIDYAIRYASNKNINFSYQKYSDILDEVLKTIIQQGKGIEVNTSGYKYGLGMPHPHIDIIKRYKELGGELITIGSDGHKPEHLAYDFNVIEQQLLAIGYKYYAIFRNRKPTMITL